MLAAARISYKLSPYDSNTASGKKESPIVRCKYVMEFSMPKYSSLDVMAFDFVFGIVEFFFWSYSFGGRQGVEHAP